MIHTDIVPQDILDFWFKNIDSKDWFNASPEFDHTIKTRFLEVSTLNAQCVRADTHHEWASNAEGALALILTLDQFPRNMFRGTPKAFEWDNSAQSVASRMIEIGHDLAIPARQRAFVYMPFMHAENLYAQNRCVELCTERLEDKSTLRHAKAHRELIKTFGRFPHRNKILGRKSTSTEIEFLAKGGYSP